MTEAAGPDGEPPVRVVIVEDHPLYADALAEVVRAGPGMALELVCSRMAQVPPRFDPPPDVVLLDLRLPDVTGAEGVAKLSARGMRVLVLSAVDDRDAVLAALQAGALGYLTKQAGAQQIAEAVRTVAAGQTYISPTLASHLLAASRPTRGQAPALTPREREVLVLLAAGATDQDIAEALNVQVRTVRSYLERVREKTGRRRRPDLTRYAIAEGLLDSGLDEGFRPHPVRRRPV